MRNAMSTTIDESNLQSLKKLSIAQLRQLWLERMGRKPVPKVKIVLMRELAWHLQAQTHGGIDAETQKLLRSAMRQASPGKTKRTSEASPKRRGAQTELRPGVRLVRVWRGTRHEVLVLEDGKRFEYRGKIYKSLTRITKEITGTHASGPRFFGLHKTTSADH